MTTHAYSVAQQVANRIRPYFLRHISETGASRIENAPLPDAEVIAAIIDATFWASLRREEGFSPKISLAYLPPEKSDSPLLFAQVLPLKPEALTRLAPAVERPGIHLGVWTQGDELAVWGTTRSLPPKCFVLEVISPGLLVLKCSPGENSAKYTNIAVLEGDKIKILTGDHEFPQTLSSLFESESRSGSTGSVLLQLAVSMRAHGRGGAVVVVPNDSSNWRDSIHSTSYPVDPPFGELAELIDRKPPERVHLPWQKNFRQSVDAIAGLTAVDGVTVITNDYRVLAFGAKIKRRIGYAPIEKVWLTEPVEHAEAEVVDPAQLGGTRHLSAAQFVQDQQDSFALVASQDGRFTLLAWSSRDGMVHAHRIEALLM